MFDELLGLDLLGFDGNNERYVYLHIAMVNRILFYCTHVFLLYIVDNNGEDWVL